MLILLIVVLSASCGYVTNGTWDDDPKNWKRAFESAKPQDVVVVHSKYWRSPHWSLEFEYFFEIAPSSALKSQLFTANKLRQTSGAEAERVRASIFGVRPAWFAPMASSAYEIWVLADRPDGHFKVLIDKGSGEMFINDYHV